tara:strand:+ start:1983 stop:2177 length:195 start_codon:yes stop_codon:yes gene_type:complete
MNFLKRLFKDEYGGESVELALVVSTVAIGSIAGYKSVSTNLTTGLSGVAEGITEGTDNPVAPGG